jgi:hypothetical protein
MRAAVVPVAVTTVPPVAVILQGAVLRSTMEPQGVSLGLGKGEELFAEGDAGDYLAQGRGRYGTHL